MFSRTCSCSSSIVQFVLNGYPASSRTKAGIMDRIKKGVVGIFLLIIYLSLVWEAQYRDKSSLFPWRNPMWIPAHGSFFARLEDPLSGQLSPNPTNNTNNLCPDTGDQTTFPSDEGEATRAHRALRRHGVRVASVVPPSAPSSITPQLSAPPSLAFPDVATSRT